MTPTQDFIQWCYYKHDSTNQKYAGLPYSFHLRCVVAQGEKFKHLIPLVSGQDMALMGCAGHDLIEDARMTYNDIKERSNESVAEIIFLCTEMRGRNRKERKPPEFYAQLKTSQLAVFVKLCDVMANIKFGLLENSSMLEMHRKEYPAYVKELWVSEYSIMFDYIEQILKVK